MIFPSRRRKLFGFLDHGHSLTLASENKLLTGLILAVAVIKKIRKYCPWRKFVWIGRIPREKLWLQVFRIKHNYIDLGNFHPILFVLIQECILLCSPNWTGGGVYCLRTEAHSLYTLTSIFANSGTAWENCWILQKK